MNEVSVSNVRPHSTALPMTNATSSARQVQNCRNRLGRPPPVAIATAAQCGKAVGVRVQIAPQAGSRRYRSSQAPVHQLIGHPASARHVGSARIPGAG